MTSLRRMLTRWLVVAMSVAAVCVGGGLYAYLSHVVQQDFDHALSLRAHALEALVAIKPDGRWDLDIHTSAWHEYTTPTSGEFYRVMDEHGQPIITSATDPLRDSPMLGDGETAEHTLPAGTHVRLAAAKFQPPIEDDDAPGLPQIPPAQPVRPWVTVLVGRDRRRLDEQLWHVAAGVGGMTIALIVTAVAATALIVRAGLSRLNTVAAQMAAIDFTRPDAAFHAADLPAELAGVAEQFNQMLRRVSSTLARERRFTADVAHELRTPIAELRTATEVALRQQTPAASTRGVERAHGIALQMQTVVSTLLALVRGDTVAEHMQLVAVDLKTTIDQALDNQPGGRGIHHDVAPGLFVQADRELISSVLNNVIGNALQHTSDLTSVRIRAAAEANDVRLTIDNAQTGLSADDLSHLFEPLWRKDVARQRGVNLGLGLSLTQAYCRAMGMTLTATLPTPTRFCLTITLPRATSTLTTPATPAVRPLTPMTSASAANDRA